MAYLHSCRVVHRDIKPQNILIDDRPESPTHLHVRIADFGLSRAVELPPDTTAENVMSVILHAAIRKSKSEENLSQSGPCDGSAGDETPSPAADDVESFGRVGAPLLQRKMTPWVVSRAYRAPEVVLCEGNYSQVNCHRILASVIAFVLVFNAHAQAIDVWSVGCILAEIFQLLKPADQRQGDHCRPHTSSPMRFPKKLFDKTLGVCSREEAQDDDWQIHVKEIFKLLGSLSAKDIESLDDLKVWDYMSRRYLTPEEIKVRIGAMGHFPRKNLEQLFESCPHEAVDMLQQMLHFKAGAIRNSSSFRHPSAASTSPLTFAPDERISMHSAHAHAFHRHRESSPPPRGNSDQEVMLK